MEGIVVTFPSIAPQEVPRWADQQGHRALSRVQTGELSAGRQALEGAELAPGNAETSRQLRLRPSTPPRTSATPHCASRPRSTVRIG